MELSPEDNLRINVLLAQNMQAVRIDESKMIVYALTDRGEAKIQLNPNCKDEQYIKLIKSILSSHVTGSPGGYPVFLKRWTRMGQARDENLQQMLLLGEPEAVVATVHAPGLTDELAARAWWAMPTADNARRMLEKEAVVKGETGPILAEFLVEFLPFEEDQHDMIDSVRLVLQPGLISDEEKNKLWSRGKAKGNYYVGFLHALPDNLPEKTEAHPLYEHVTKKLKPLIEEKNIYAISLQRILGDKGQCFIKTVETVLTKPSNQDVVISLLDALENYFSDVRPQEFSARDMESICNNIDNICANTEYGIDEVIDVVPDVRNMLHAITILSCLSVEVVNPVFARTDAIGTVMRKKIKPVTDHIFRQLACLRN